MVFLVVIFFMSVSFAPLSASQREAYRIPPRRPAFSYHLRVEVFPSVVWLRLRRSVGVGRLRKHLRARGPEGRSDGPGGVLQAVGAEPVLRPRLWRHRP